MRCPTLSELPAAPSGKSGWPWAEESQQAPESIGGLGAWPEASIITPSYNQGLFLEETIRSVLLQGYPNLEYFVIDGGSTDESVEILRKYERWLAGWVSEPDNGQSDAVNKGLKRAQGEFVGWLNSDDLYLPGAVVEAAKFLKNTPNTSVVYGQCYYTDDQGKTLSPYSVSEFDLNRLLSVCFIPQPAAFFRRQVVEEVGELDVGLHRAMDYEFWLRLAMRGKEFALLPRPLATYRLWSGSKTASASPRHSASVEVDAVLEKVCAGLDPAMRKALRTGCTGAYLVRGYLWYDELQLPRARGNWLKAMWLDPLLPLRRPDMVLCFLKSLMGANLLSRLRARFKSSKVNRTA